MTLRYVTTESGKDQAWNAIVGIIPTITLSKNMAGNRWNFAFLVYWLEIR
jgi:hypothetical protein